MGVSKVVLGDRTLIDLTETTVTPATLLKGSTAIDSAGELIEGTAEIGTGSGASNFYFTDSSDGTQYQLSDLTFVEKEGS